LVLYILIAVGVLVVAAALVALLTRRGTGDDTQRFARVRQLTTTWAYESELSTSLGARVRDDKSDTTLSADAVVEPAGGHVEVTAAPPAPVAAVTTQRRRTTRTTRPRTAREAYPAETAAQEPADTPARVSLTDVDVTDEVVNTAAPIPIERRRRTR
jgi:hypothetical protein